MSGYKGFGNGRPHSGLNGDTIYWQGSLTTVGYYDKDYNCDVMISTRTHSYTNSCNGYGGPGWDPNAVLWTSDPGYGYLANNDYRVGSSDEPIGHIACELAWYLYNTFSSVNVVLVTHSMGGVIARHMIEKVGHDSHFPPSLHISDVVTMSSPHGGLSHAQVTGETQYCVGPCYQILEMERSSSYLHPFMKDLTNNANNPQAAGGTDWTMMGSLSSDDPLDWFWQSTYMSNGHRLGYALNIPACTGQPGWKNGYGHGDYMNDMCDQYNAPQYYKDFDSRDSQAYYYTTAAPHSLHNMLLAFVYYGW